MTDFLTGLLALIRKEILMIFKDKIGRIILVMPVIAQTIMFGYVATFDLNRADYALLDQDHSSESRELARQFDGSGVFRRVADLNSESEIAQILDNKKALMVLHIGPQFARRLNLGQNAGVQTLFDGRNSNLAGAANGFAAGLVGEYNKKRLMDAGLARNAVSVTSRAWFNPNLETRWNIIAGLMAVLSVIQVMILAGESAAREKEQGTFDQLLVTPLGPMRVMFGKALPPVLIGIGQSTIILLVAINWFKIPFSGSFTLLCLGLLIFDCAIVGVGLCISALTSTMQQAVLFSFSLLLPMVLLSGFATPISSMPAILQSATLLNPVRYGVEIAQRIYLEGAGFQEMKAAFTSLAAMAVVSLGAAAKLFRGH
jgi:ABC-2 type transport system permease protein